MKKNNDEKMISRAYIIGAIVLGIIAIIAIIAIIVVMTSIFVPREHTSKAQKYDLGCVTQLNERPLQECRQ